MQKALRLSKKVLKWMLLVAVGLFVLLLIAIEGFDRYVSSESGTRWLYTKVTGVDSLNIQYTASGIRYLSIGDPQKQPLLLIHGAPGGFYDWLALANHKEIYQKYRLLIPERPGYGGTKPRKPERSILVHAQRLLEVLDNEDQKAVVMGHSYGGPIAVLMGALAPEKIDRIIGASGQYDPDNEIVMGISPYIHFKIFKLFVPRLLWMANVEKMTHPHALQEIMPYYAKVRVPVILIHGDADTLVLYENSPFLMEHLDTKKELITLTGKDHPIHVQETDYLVDFLMN